MNSLALSEADFGVRTAPDAVRVERLLPGPIERVWQYLTDPALRAQWLAGGEMDQRVGGDVDLVFHNNALTENDDPPPPKYEKHGGVSHLRGRVTECDPPRALAYTWGEDADASHVRFELEARGDQVRLSVTHSRLASAEGMLSVASGWHTHLSVLRDRMNGRTPEGFWRSLTRVNAEYARRLS